MWFDGMLYVVVVWLLVYGDMVVLFDVLVVGKLLGVVKVV